MKLSLLRLLLGFIIKNQGALSSALVRLAKVALLGAIAALVGSQVWGEFLTPTGVSVVTAVLMGLEKLIKEKVGVGL